MEALPRRVVAWRVLLGLAVVAGISACTTDDAGPAADAGATADDTRAADDTSAADDDALEDGVDVGAPDVDDAGEGSAGDARNDPLDTPAGDAGGGDTGGHDAGPTDATADVPEAPPWTSCVVDADCDDGLPCTHDACGADGACVWTVASGCLVANVCVAEGASPADASCQVCRPALSATAWSPRDDGDACQGPCEAWGTCLAGACQALGPACDDDNPCTTDACPGGECSHGYDNAASCDDGDACTLDTCDPQDGACAHEHAALPCDDDDPCTGPDVCADGDCTAGPQDCDDASACTIDFCHPVKGCAHLPTENPCCVGETSLCDDGNPCTTYDCDNCIHPTAIQRHRRVDSGVGPPRRRAASRPDRRGDGPG